MPDDHVPVPADGKGAPPVRGDGVGEVAGGGGESGGGAYPNPHTGKEARGEGGAFEGGQSGKTYYGPGVLDGKKLDPAAPRSSGDDG